MSYRFTQIGSINKGAPKTSRGTWGKDLPYFRVVFNDTPEDQASGVIFRERHGNEPTEIPVVFFFDSPDDVWETWLEAYTGSGAKVMMVHPDDNVVQFHMDPWTGEVLVRNGRSVQTGEIVVYDGGPAYTYRHKETGETRHVYPSLRCRLRCIVPALGRLAYLLLKTGSWYDRRALTDQLWSVYEINGRSIKGVPFILRRREREVLTRRPDGRKVRESKNLLSIETDPKWAEAKIGALIAGAMPGVESVAPSVMEIDERPEEPDDIEEPPAVPTGDTEDLPIIGPDEEAPESAGKLGDDPATQFWAKIKLLGLDEQAQEFIEGTESMGEALENLNKAFPDVTAKVEEAKDAAEKS